MDASITILSFRPSFLAHGPICPICKTSIVLNSKREIIDAHPQMSKGVTY